MNRRTKTAVLGATLLLTATAAASASAAASEEKRREAAALTGSARMQRPDAGEDLMFSFDAHLAVKDRDDPSRATGTFEFSHYLNGTGAWAKAEVDCLVTGGKVAVVSGVVTDTNLDEIKGHRVGVTVHDTGDADRVGYSWAATEDMGPADLPRCVSSAPYEKVEKGTGDFTVVPWQPRF
ncbi:Repetin [Streptomyces sp. NPDC050619]|uniref:Repetin n=1 Tax=Streptomyces sp. NPDC050619 TaxID=3157214 RepID=UPI0034397D2C